MTLPEEQLARLRALQAELSGDRGEAPAARSMLPRLGDVFLVGPEATPAEARRLMEIYREACARHGVERARVAIRRDVHVGADAERVADVRSVRRANDTDAAVYIARAQAYRAPDAKPD